MSGFVANFQVATWNSEDVLVAFEASRNPKHGHGHGHAKILNRNYETVKEVRGSNNLLDIHEFRVLNEKTALVESYRPTPINLRDYGAGPWSQWIVDAVIQGNEPF